MQSEAELNVKRVGIFFILTYAFSWSMFAIGHNLELMPLIMLGIWGPSLSAIFLNAYYHGWAGLGQMFKRFGRVKVAPIWWLLLLLLPLAIHFVGRSTWELS